MLRATFRAVNSANVAARTKTTIAPGVHFENIAREWRCKWSADNDKASLAALQSELDKILPEVKKVAGVVNVQRVVCGGCLDFKVAVKLDADSFKKWAGDNFKPETAFLDKIKTIKGVSQVETQTYTLETL